MNAGFELKKPEVVYEASESQRGMHWGLEILLFLLMFFLSAIGEMIILIPGELILLFSNSAYQEAILAQDMERVTEISLKIASSDTYSVLMLFANLAMILIVCLFCRLFQKRRPRTLGFRREGALKEYLFGLAAGFLVFSVAVLLCVVTGSLKLEGLSATFSPWMFLLFLMGYMIQGMAEETICRGYFMVSVARRYPLAVAIFANALVFAALHLLNNGISVLAFINLTLFGVFASVYFIRRGNIWGIGAFHSAWNLVQGNLYGIRVSGGESECSVLQSSMVTGRELWNGGEFGLEGGLAVTLVLLAGLAILLFVRQTDASSQNL